MKTQIVLLSMFLFAVNPPKALQVATFSGTRSAKISKTQSFDFIFFRTHHQCKGVIVAWALNSTNGVTGFTLQRTTQNPSNANTAWEDVESFVAGSEPFSRYTDRNVTAGYISYRVIAWIFDGSAVTSEVSSVRICGHH